MQQCDIQMRMILALVYADENHMFYENFIKECENMNIPFFSIGDLKGSEALA